MPLSPDEVLGYDYDVSDYGPPFDAADPGILRRLSENNPDYQSLNVALYDNRIANNQDYAKELGRAISKSKHLREIIIDGRDNDDDDGPQQPLLSFFMGLAENRAIEDLSLYHFNHSRMDMDVFRTLAPFFEHNRNLRRICMYHIAQLRERIPSLISALKQAHGLQYIDIADNELGDSILADLINALRSMPGLHNLSVLCLGGNMIGQQGCAALRKLLRHPACNIQSLSIRGNPLDNACMEILYGGSVSYNFFIKSIKQGCAALRKLLCLRINKGLRSPTCSLRELDISGCQINDKGALVLASVLREINSLEYFYMCDNMNITSSGWIDFFHIMRQYEIRLKDLHLGDNNIDDEGATILVTILVNMSSLEYFSLDGMTSVSADGWRKFARVVKPTISSSKLRLLSLGNPYNTPPQIDDSVIICFADALINNTSLTTLWFKGYVLSEVGRRALANALCDKSSLVNTFLSNHTLQSIYFGFAFNGGLRSLLAKNRCKNKFEVARRKILATHFVDDSACVRIFAPMPAPTLPTALSWIGRDRREYSLMYHFFHSMSWPLDSTEISSME